VIKCFISDGQAHFPQILIIIVVVIIVGLVIITGVNFDSYVGKKQAEVTCLFCYIYGDVIRFIVRRKSVCLCMEQFVCTSPLLSLIR